jgi:DNA-binding NarL/FixJ family response regulator
MKHKVLIVDDLPQARDGLRTVLGTYPEIEVVGEAADGREAVRLVETTRPDVVLMDVEMPGLDGLDATRQIKASWPQVAVIVLTIHSSHQVEALAAGADAFFSKGVPTEELVEAIHRLSKAKEQEK